MLKIKADVCLHLSLGQLNGLPIINEEISLGLLIMVQSHYQSKDILSTGSGSESWLLRGNDGPPTDVNLGRREGGGW